MKQLFRLILLSMVMLLGLGLQTKAQREQVADETTISYTQKQIKLETTNLEIYDKLVDKYEDHFIRVSTSYKTDRHGRYKLWTMYMPKEMESEVVKYIRSIPRRRP